MSWQKHPVPGFPFGSLEILILVAYSTWLTNCRPLRSYCGGLKNVAFTSPHPLKSYHGDLEYTTFTLAASTISYHGTIPLYVIFLLVSLRTLTLAASRIWLESTRSAPPLFSFLEELGRKTACFWASRSANRRKRRLPNTAGTPGVSGSHICRNS